MVMFFPTDKKTWPRSIANTGFSVSFGKISVIEVAYSLIRKLERILLRPFTLFVVCFTRLILCLFRVFAKP